MHFQTEVKSFGAVKRTEREREREIVKKSKAIPVTDSEVPYNCETSRLPNYLDNRLTDGGKVVSLKRRPPFTPQEYSGYSFLLEAESTREPLYRF
jgi:hypothetical protein